MAAEHEIERLLVRLVGDGSGYTAVLDKAVKDTTQAVDQIQRRAKEAAAQNKVLREAAQITQSVATPLEKYRKEIDRLSAHLRNGSISQKTFDRAVLQAEADLEKAAHAGVKFKNEIIQAELVVRKSTFSMEQFGRGVRSAGTAIRGFGLSMSLAVTTPLVAFLAASGAAAIKMDSLKLGLNAVSGSAEATEAQLVRLREVSKLPGLGFPEAIQGSVALQAAGFSADLAERSLMGFGNALVSVGRGKQDLDGVIRALTQIVGKGKVSAEEINQIAERLPQIRQIMKDAFGTADTEQIQKMGLEVEVFVEKIVTELEKLPKVTGGARNALENLGDDTFIALSKVGDVVLKIVLPYMEKLAEFIKLAADRFGQLDPAVQTFIIGAIAVVAVIGPILVGLGMMIALAGAAITGITALVGAISTIGLPVAAVIAAVVVGLGVFAAEIAAIVYLLLGPDGIKNALTTFATAAKDVVLKVVGFFYNFRENMGILFKWFDDKFMGFPRKLFAFLKIVVTQIRVMVQQQLGFVGTAISKVLQFAGKFANLPEFNFDLPTFDEAAAPPELPTAPGGLASTQELLRQKELEAQAKELADAIIGVNAELQNQVDTFGMSATEAKLFALAQQGATEASLESARALAQQVETLNQKKAVDALNTSLQEQINTYGMTSQQIAVYRLRSQGVSDDLLRHTVSLHKQLAALDDQKKAMEDQQKLLDKGKQVTDQYLTPQEKFLKQQSELNNLLAVGAINRTTFDRAMKGATDELEKLEGQSKIQITFDFDNEAVRAGSSEFRKLLAEASGRSAGPILQRRVEAQSGILDVGPGRASGGVDGPTLLNRLERIAIATEATAQKEGVTLEPAEFDS